MARTPFVAGNWKMNTTHAEAKQLAQAVANQTSAYAGQVEVAVCPPAIWLTAVATVLGKGGGIGEPVGTEYHVGVGAQNVSPEGFGAFTGQINCAMLKEAGASYVIVGHSETRHTIDRGESPEYLNAKVKAVLAAELTPIYCVGETLEQREAGQTEQVNLQQMAEGFDGLDEAAASEVVVAYEPVWAIGTGKTATPEQAQEVHASIRGWLRETYGDAVADGCRIQYGGSMKPSNAAELLSQPDIDGGLIGGAALKPDDFAAIVAAAAK